MSTRSVIARQLGDGWEGRYVNSDGYPTGRIPLLFKIREAFNGDLDRMLTYYLDEHGAWSAIGSDIETPAGYFTTIPDRNTDPDGYARFFNGNHCYCHGDRSEDVMDDWHRHTDTDSDCEWAYVLNDVGIAVWMYDRAPADTPDRVPFQGAYRFLALVRWNTPPDEAALAVIECGANFERCGHYAYAHFPEAEGTSYSSAVWLGVEQPQLHDATHVRRHGITYTMTHSGHTERKFGGGYTNRWYSGVIRPDGTKFDMWTRSHTNDGEFPAPGVTHIFDGLPAASNPT